MTRLESAQATKIVYWKTILAPQPAAVSVEMQVSLEVVWHVHAGEVK